MSWVSLEKWGLKHAPEVVERLSAGADPAGIAAAERVTGFDWPADYRAWLLEHDGASSILPVVLMNVSAVVATWRMLGELHASREHDDLVRADAGVRAHWWQAGWLPITADGAGNHLCLDLVPAAGGRVGQVIEFWHDGGERRVLAPSFAAWLASVQLRLASGDLVATVEHGVMERASLRRVLVVCRILGESEADWRARIATEKRLDPGWVLVSMITSLNRYQLIELADSAPFAIMAGPISRMSSRARQRWPSGRSSGLRRRPVSSMAQPRAKRRGSERSISCASASPVRPWPCWSPRPLELSVPTKPFKTREISRPAARTPSSPEHEGGDDGDAGAHQRRR